MTSTPDMHINLNPQVIYNYDTHRNIPWNIVEYEPLRQYLDPRQIVTERKYQQTKKGQKYNGYVTRRGFYMDYQLKVAKSIPGSNVHTSRDPWDQSENQKKSKSIKIDPKLTKNTYIEQIQIEEKNRSKPAPGRYNLNKTDKEIEQHKKVLKSKKRFIGDKHFFYQQFENLSNSVPGMGHYNPHDNIPNLHMNKTTHKFWIDKHKKQYSHEKKRDSLKPASGTYTPIPLQYSTFDRIKTADLTARKKKQTVHGFGTDAKFPYDRPNKKKIQQKRPPPCQYQIALEWKGKNMDLRGHNWIRSRSTGFSSSVYH